MTAIEVVFVMLGAMIVLVAIARRINVPYPILLVLGGLVIGFVPGLPKVEIEPDMVFFLFLPPILQSAAYFTSIRDFKANARSIGLLSIGLVLFSTVLVAIVAHSVIEDMSWAAAFVLGAIVAPPDAVAATAIAQRMKLPRRIVTVLEGESLVNDATALVAYRVAITAVVSGTFSLLDASWMFVVSAVGGVIVGVVVSWALQPVFRLVVNDVPVFAILTFVSGFLAYQVGELLHVSGVLATVALGLTYVFPRFNSMTAELRVRITPVWEIVVFLINGLVFILIGLQLRTIVEDLHNESVSTLLWYAVVICLATIVVRILWVFPATYLPRLPKKVRERDPFPQWQHVTIVAWTGMRGIVSLAAALSLPRTVESGAPFPQRELIIFLTFSVILATLVLQGLSLPLLVRVLNVHDDGGAIKEENKARMKAAHAGRNRLRDMVREGRLAEDMAAKLTHSYEARIRRFTARYNGERDGEVEDKFDLFEQVQLELLEAETMAVRQLRNDGIINDEVLRRVQNDLDLEMVRLKRTEE